MLEWTLYILCLSCSHVTFLWSYSSYVYFIHLLSILSWSVFPVDWGPAAWFRAWSFCNYKTLIKTWSQFLTINFSFRIILSELSLLCNAGKRCIHYFPLGSPDGLTFRWHAYHGYMHICYGAFLCWCFKFLYDHLKSSFGYLLIGWDPKGQIVLVEVVSSVFSGNLGIFRVVRLLAAGWLGL